MTHRLPFQATLFQELLVIPVVTAIHVIPSLLYAIFPVSPTATQICPFQATLLQKLVKIALAVALPVQLSPFALCATRFVVDPEAATQPAPL